MNENSCTSNPTFNILHVWYSGIVGTLCINNIELTHGAHWNSS